MKIIYKYIIISVALIVFLTSCNTLEKASMHGFNSGYYKFESKPKSDQNVYVDVTDEKIDVYHETKKQPEKNAFLTIPLKPSDSILVSPIVFKKKSLDIDITAILLKYRPSVYGLPGQMTTDFNIALYAGWRHDSYNIVSRMNPLGKSHNKINNRGYDFGLFAGPGATLISPFTTQNKVTDEYSGMIIQTGFAGFIESNIASFGIAVGFDSLLNSDREVWIYNKKLWVGFIVGIALN
ncbi:hypothetical protein [Flavobacterium soyangense]|uniref:Lipoprotein n=1 Tax=Flavobacterium soyangense TaxID=2023265 RepID=A0A930UFC9_9FLAO|nr:hypothetical protein [Flavobacterium soyangense]MBF2709857.1 hypothetical protein [Flavobacterium soyangense]